MELSDKQKAKLLATAEIVEKGDLAVLSKLYEIDERVEENTEKLDSAVALAEGKVTTIDEKVDSLLKDFTEKVETKLSELRHGTDYVLTEEDKQVIAQSVIIPTMTVEKVIEKTEVTKEQPIVTEITKVTNEIVEVAVTDAPDVIVDKVNSSSKKINREQVDGLKDIENMARINAMPVTTTHYFRTNSPTGRAKNINFIGSRVEISGDQAVVTPIVVSDTEPSNPLYGELWLDVS